MKNINYFWEGNSMFCQKCGKNLPDDATFCPSCGQKISNGQPVVNEQPVYQVQPKPEKKGCLHSFATVAKVLVGLFVLLFLFIAFFGGGKKSKVADSPEQRAKQVQEYQNYMAETYSMMKTVETEWAIVCDIMLSPNATPNSAYETLDKSNKVIDKVYEKFMFRDTPDSISDDDIKKMNEELGHWCNRHQTAIESMMEGVNKGRFSPKDNTELKKQILLIDEKKQEAWEIIQKLDAKYLPKEGEQVQPQAEPTKEKPKSTLKKIMDNM